MRVHFLGSTMTYRQADTLLYYLENKSEVISAKVYERTGDAVIRYKESDIEYWKCCVASVMIRLLFRMKYLRHQGGH